MTFDAPVADVPTLELRSIIDGDPIDAPERIGWLYDPNTGQVRQDQVAASLSDVERALIAADQLHASGQLEAVPVEARIDLLIALAGKLDEHQDAIAQQDAMATGNPIATTRLLASFLGDRVRSNAEQLRQLRDATPLAADRRDVRIYHRALGPALVLAPWNAPTFVAASKATAAIAAAAPLLLKPSEWAPGGAQIMMELLRVLLQDAGFPSATAQMLHGGSRVGAALSGDRRVRAISFTGGLAAGRAVATAAARNLTVTQLELGSNNPAIVMPDADVERTAAMLIDGTTRLNGQWCEAPGKVLAPAALRAELVEALVERAATLTIGHCLSVGTQLGPLAFEAHRDRLAAQIAAYRAAGAAVHVAGAAPTEGWFLAPTVIDGLDAADAQTEMFGPALTVHAYDAIGDAVRAANGPGGGLDAFVFGSDEEAAIAVGSQIHAGEVRVNGTHMADLADGSQQTFWNDAGVGGHGPANAVPFFQGRRVVGVDAARLPI